MPIGALGACLLVAVGCGGGPGPTPGAPTGASPVAGHGYRILVDEPGVEPRRRLDQPPEPGRVDIVSLRTDTTDRTVVAGNESVAPTERVDLELRVGPPVADGPVHRAPFEIVRSLGGDDGEPAGEADASAPAPTDPSPAVGRRGTVVRDRLGRLRGWTLEPRRPPASDEGGAAPPGFPEDTALADALESAFRSFPVVPAVAVGPGATWSVQTRTESPLPVTQRATIRLIRFDGPTAVLDVQVDQQGGASVLETAGGTVRVNRIAGTATARAWLTPGALMPDGLNAEATVELEGETEIDGTSVPLRIHTRVVTELVAVQPSTGSSSSSSPAGPSPRVSQLSSSQKGSSSSGMPDRVTRGSRR